jgi:hypothetical protein
MRKVLPLHSRRRAAPSKLAMRTLAITVMTPEESLEDVIEEADPIIDSIEFHAP